MTQREPLLHRNEPPRCPCGCGIFMQSPDWLATHFDDEFRCKMCGQSAAASHIGTVTLRDGSETFCPLCAYGVAMSQLERHAEDLARIRTAAQCLTPEDLKAIVLRVTGPWEGRQHA